MRLEGEIKFCLSADFRDNLGQEGVVLDLAERFDEGGGQV